MKEADPSTIFSERIDRFVRWFFATSPTDIVDVPQPVPVRPATRAVSQTVPPQVRPQHAGPVRVAAKGKS